MPRPGEVVDTNTAIIFLGESARYFENRPTGGEDRAYWSNVFNAENCRKIIFLLSNCEAEINRLCTELAEANDEAMEVRDRFL